jgi:DNA-binding transcriptional LysR family regulator
VRSLANESFILFPRSLAPGLYDPIISLCQQAEFSPIVVQEATQMQTIVSLVAAEIGIAIVPASMQHLQRTGVVYRSIQGKTPEVAIALFWQRDHQSPVLKKFLATAKEAVTPSKIRNMD